jgi:hypothetical protein
MNREQCREFENTINSLLGLHLSVQMHIRNLEVNNVFECSSQELNDRCRDYMQLPQEERKFEIGKVDTDSKDFMTYTLQFKKLHI